jgi:hypothetical protein
MFHRLMGRRFGSKTIGEVTKCGGKLWQVDEPWLNSPHVSHIPSLISSNLKSEFMMNLFQFEQSGLWAVASLAGMLVRAGEAGSRTNVSTGLSGIFTKRRMS